MPHPGEVFGDRYRLDERIAAGGMGEVWQAIDIVLGRDVAIKTLHAGWAADAGFQNRFRHEARAMAVLHHPGVADVYDYGQNGPDAYIVMARVHGQPLHERIASSGRLSATETMSVVAQAARALETAHQAGIVHRDVKPGNLIIRPDGMVVLVDFGVARSAESAALTGAGEVIGTALYIAPEQVSKQQTGPAADLYALGAVAYHCLAGRPPFDGPTAVGVAMQHVRDTPPPLPEDVPPAVRALVATAMAKAPMDRFGSAAAMAQAAERVLGGPRDADTTTLAAVMPARGSTPDTAAGAGIGAVGGVGTGTAVLPAVLPEGRGRKRTPLIVALAAVVFGRALLTLAAVNPGHIFPNSDAPAESATEAPSGPPSATASPSRTGNRRNPAPEPTNRMTRRAPSTATTAAPPTAGATKDETPASPPDEATTTAPAAGGTPTSPTAGGAGGGGDEDAAPTPAAP